MYCLGRDDDDFDGDDDGEPLPRTTVARWDGLSLLLSLEEDPWRHLCVKVGPGEQEEVGTVPVPSPCRRWPRYHTVARRSCCDPRENATITPVLSMPDWLGSRNIITVVSEQRRPIDFTVCAVVCWSMKPK